MRFLRILAGVGAMLPICAASASPVLSLDSAQAIPGSTTQLAVRFTTDTNVTGLQFDLSFGTNYLQLGSVVRGDSLSDHILGTNLLAPGLFRVLTISPSDTALVNGTIIYMPFTIATNAPDHNEALTLSNFLGVNSNGDLVSLFASNGVLSVVIPPRFGTITPTNGGVMHLEFTGTTGRVYVIQATTNLSPPLWTSLTTNTNVNGIQPYDDVSAPGIPRRFYRARIER